MCGRTFCSLEPEEIRKRCATVLKRSSKCIQLNLNDRVSQNSYQTSYNISPQCFTLVLHHLPYICENNDEKFDLTLMKWGLVPCFITSSSSSFQTNNARLETLDKKPSYSKPLALGKVCIVLAEGFYEWKQIGLCKQPYLIQPSESQLPLLMMAGIYEINKEGQYSYAVITTDSFGPIQDIHERMPVIFTESEDVSNWLNIRPGQSKSAIDFLHKVASKMSYPNKFTIYPVSSRVNYTKFDTQECIKPCEISKSADQKVLYSFIGFSHQK